ncbi:MAG: FAD-dependent oxidoreductase [Chloroflexi bacterium]|nr:FAD-dependent oxidoreductase [Chloroflexota bacterium]
MTKQVWAAEAMANAAKQRGAAFHGDAKVTGVVVVDGRVAGVETANGSIKTDTIVLAAGIWGPVIGRMAGVPVPLQPLRHQYAHTEPLPELSGVADEFRDPILRHQDASMYLRQREDHYVIGSYRHEPLLVEPEEILDWDRAPEMPSMMEWEDEIFQFCRKAAGEVIPSLRGVELGRKVNGMFSFTPDGMPLLGESPQVLGFWLAEAVWITHAGGVGKAVAEWMVDGSPGSDLHECDVGRFHPHATTRSYVRARGAQQYREVYDIIHPLQQMERPRDLRLTPFHARHKELGALFFESAGWERPQWYEANGRLLDGRVDDPPMRSGWESRHWSPIIAAEHRATREGAGMFDLTPFTKLEVSGPGALGFLQYLATNQMDQPVGKVTYTPMLNRHGRIKCDLTVTRLEAERFLVVTGGLFGAHDLAWLRAHLPGDGSVDIVDLTSSRCCIGLWGPEARAVMSAVSGDDLSNDAFPYMTAREVTIGNVPALALRISYVGELGWELYAPREFGLGLWDALWVAGEAHGVVAVGGGAFDSLRLEKGYRLWGADIHTEYNPYEAGTGFAVRSNKGDFLGRDALIRVREQGVERRLRCMTLDEREIALMGKEPLLDGDRVLGYVTSAGYGATVGESIVYGYLPIDYAVEGTKVEVEYFGERHGVTVTSEPRYDPSGSRLRA